MLSTIIVAAGSSQRMGFDKLFAKLGDKTVVGHTLAAFDRTGSVGEIIVVGRDDRLTELQEIVRRDQLVKVRHIAPGGVHRQDSVQCGLNLVDAAATHVAVHDAARPLITPEQIERVLAACRTHGAATLAEPVTDTIKRSDVDGFVAGGVDRAQLYAMQTPQIFERDLLIRAYAAVAKEQFRITDEVSAVERLGAKVFLVPNEDVNIKITYPRDLGLAQLYLGRLATGS